MPRWPLPCAYGFYLCGCLLGFQFQNVQAMPRWRSPRHGSTLWGGTGRPPVHATGDGTGQLSPLDTHTPSDPLHPPTASLHCVPPRGPERRAPGSLSLPPQGWLLLSGPPSSHSHVTTSPVPSAACVFVLLFLELLIFNITCVSFSPREDSPYVHSPPLRPVSHDYFNHLIDKEGPAAAVSPWAAFPGPRRVNGIH